MRKLINAFDASQRKRLGVFEFCDPKECFFRLQVATAPHLLDFPHHQVQAGETVLIIHLWNEHLPPYPQAGPDLAWGRLFLRGFIQSLRAAARQTQIDPGLAGIRAVGGVTALLFSGYRNSGARVHTSLGFTVVPYFNPLGRFGEFWENFYSWLLIWAYNPRGLVFKRLLQMQRAEFWIPLSEFLDCYGNNSLASRRGE